MRKRINETLLELIIGILISGAVIQAAAVALTGFLPKFALGFWIGVATAAGLAGHMYWSIDRALDMNSEDADKYMRRAYMIRTVVILVVAGVVTYFKIGYVMATFGGVFCLKFGAFLQPLTHRILGRQNAKANSESCTDQKEETGFPISAEQDDKSGFEQ